MKFTSYENGFSTHLPFGELKVSGDENYGFRPYQLLVSSIAVCSAGVLKKVLNKMRIDFDDLSFSTDTVRIAEEANRVAEIKIHFIIKGNNLSVDKIAKAIEVSANNCPMVQSVKDSITITKTFDLVS